MPFKVIVLLLRTKRAKMLFIHYVFDNVASKFYFLYKNGKITCPVCLKAPRGIKMDLQIKVGGVLKNSGNSLSDGHRNFPISTIGT